MARGAFFLTSCGGWGKITAVDFRKERTGMRKRLLLEPAADESGLCCFPALFAGLTCGRRYEEKYGEDRHDTGGNRP